MQTDKILIRKVRNSDNKFLANLIRDTLTEFKANKPGTIFYDEATDHLYETFENKKATYFVVLMNDTIAGGAGIYPTAGLPEDTCELIKMYLMPFARGKVLEDCS